MRNRLMAALVAALALLLGTVGLAVGLSLPTGPASAAGDESPAPALTELETLDTPTEPADEPSPEPDVDETTPDPVPQARTAPPSTPPASNSQAAALVPDTTPPATSWQVAPPAVVKAGDTVSIRLRAQGEADGTVIDKSIHLDGAEIGRVVSTHRNYDFRLETAGLADGVHTLRGVAVDPAGNSAEATTSFVVDGTGPTITVKPESVGGPAVFGTLSLKLFDANKVDRVIVNGVEKDLTDNQWSDVNGIKVGSFGIVDGTSFTVVAYDVVGNSTTQTFTIDATGPTITVKPESVGGPSVFRTLSLKLYDRFQVDYVVVNGVKKELTNSQWSDVNGIKVGSFGIVDGTSFTVVAYDVVGNSTTQTFTIDATGPTITVKPESVGGPDAYRLLSLKLYDRFQVDYVEINGVKKELTNSQWSDVNGIKVGQYGIQDNVPFVVKAFDVVGNVTTATFVFDLTGPTITVKPESVGGPAFYSSLSLKLFDAYQVDRVVVNGVEKDLTDNKWSDVNGITVGSFGIADGVPFTVVAFDVLGNSTSVTFTLDGTAPTITEKSVSETSVSLKLYDRSSVDHVVINGVFKDLTDNQWSDANDLRVGTFGIQDGVPFSVTVVDVAGNETTKWYTVSAVVPTATVDDSTG